MKTHTARVTSKGQVTIPKAVRERLGIAAGDDIEIVENRGVFGLRRKKTPKTFRNMIGYLKHLKGKDVDRLIEAMRGPVDW